MTAAVRRIQNEMRDRAVEVMREAAKPKEVPVVLATGETTNVYLDVKGVLTDRYSMNVAADAMIVHVAKYHANAYGGPTMGADVLSHLMVSRNWYRPEVEWFSVRDRRKADHGLGLWIEGKRLGMHDRVIIMDDVANSGKSLVEACQRVTETGAMIAAICPFVDRSGKAQHVLEDAGILAPYDPLMYYTELGIAPLKA